MTRYTISMLVACATLMFGPAAFAGHHNHNHNSNVANVANVATLAPTPAVTPPSISPTSSLNLPNHLAGHSVSWYQGRIDTDRNQIAQYTANIAKIDAKLAIRYDPDKVAGRADLVDEIARSQANLTANLTSCGSPCH